MRVDLPAPFSPTRAWISPGLTEKVTSFNALTPGNSFVMPRISSRTSLTAPPPSRAQVVEMKPRVCVVVDRRTPAMICET